jgi:hypothetical protein
MALLSDIDWTIIALVAAFLFLGRGNGEAIRTLGRWYGRAVRLKQELLAEITKAADLPVGAGAGPTSLRAALLGPEPAVPPMSHVPLPVRSPPAVPMTPAAPPPVPWTGGEPVTYWSVTGVAPEGRVDLR